MRCGRRQWHCRLEKTEWKAERRNARTLEGRTRREEKESKIRKRMKREAASWRAGRDSRRRDAGLGKDGVGSIDLGRGETTSELVVMTVACVVVR